MNDTLSQIVLYMPFGVVLLVVFICLCRLYSDRKSDERIEAEFEDIERISDRTREEAAECSDRIREIKDRASKVIKGNEIDHLS